MGRPDYCPVGNVPCQSLCDEPCTTSGETERLRKDAERYRWLRGGADVPPHSRRWPRWEVRNWSGRWWETLFAEKLDAAIDVAMQHDKVPNGEVKAAPLRGVEP